MNIQKLLAAALLAAVSAAAAAQSLTTGDITVKAGERVRLHFQLNNADDYTAAAFLLQLPETFSYTGEEGGMTRTHLSETRILSDNYKRVAVYSLSNEPFNEYASDILNIEMNVPTRPGVYKATVSGIEMANDRHEVLQLPAFNFTITVEGGTDFIPGDANGDGRVTVADYVAIAHHIMGHTPEGFNMQAADANGDGQVNVADYVAVAHIIMNEQ